MAALHDAAVVRQTHPARPNPRLRRISPAASRVGRQSSPGEKELFGSAHPVTKSHRDMLRPVGHSKKVVPRHKRQKEERISLSTKYERRYRNGTTFSTLVRGLKRLVSALQCESLGHSQKSLLDAIDELSKRLRKRIEKAEQKALMTTFYGQPPQVSIR